MPRDRPGPACQFREGARNFWHGRALDDGKFPSVCAQCEEPLSTLLQRFFASAKRRTLIAIGFHAIDGRGARVRVAAARAVRSIEQKACRLASETVLQRRRAGIELDLLPALLGVGLWPGYGRRLTPAQPRASARADRPVRGCRTAARQRERGGEIGLRDGAQFDVMAKCSSRSRATTVRRPGPIATPRREGGLEWGRGRRPSEPLHARRTMDGVSASRNDAGTRWT